MTTDSTIDPLQENPQEVAPSSIQSEEEFKERINHERTKGSIGTQIARFSELGKAVHEALTRQDSEKTLVLITRGALALGSSDVHYDNTETEVNVRFRIDGALATVFTLSKPEYKLMIERLKYKSNLKLNITDIPQDGKYRITDEGGNIDVRISTLPVRYGENAVCRILDSTRSIPPLDDLGLMWTSKRQIEKSIAQKSGTILVTGPTGSGKTTTLYTLLNTLNTPDKKIITLEDPIEYELPGVVQSEVDERKNYTYESGLKALLRQDPDVIMIGEIRDLDSATIAIQAAMTGHLVLSTLHTKSASETIERLMNMGIPNYILASGLDVILAQRLVRRLCPHCSVAHDADPSQIDIIKWMMKDIGVERIAAKQEGYKLYHAEGCEQCGYTGYKGRIGIYEVLTFNEKIRTLIRQGSSPRDIMTEARNNDLILMREDGILKAMQGKTSLDELFKVID